MGDLPRRNAVYTLRTVPFNLIEPRQGLRTIRLPDATPASSPSTRLSDEQALLARVRYNRLLDVFTGLACYPLQSHLRTSITIPSAIDGTPSSSQVETDDLYVGLDEHGAPLHPACAGQRRLRHAQRDQIWQDFEWPSRSSPT